jgi:peptide/nickel transport system substrate-binding protein
LLAAAPAGLLLGGGCSIIDRLATNSTPTSTVSKSTPTAGGVLRISQPDDIVPTGTPYRFSGANLHLLTLVYDTLISYDPRTAPRPRLATDWSWSPDARRLTLTLRPDVTFHSGRPFTSSEAKFNLEHVGDRAVGSQWQNYANLMHVSTPDSTTLVIDFDMPLKSAFDALAATYMADPVSLDDTNAGRTFIGTGPFRFKEWAQGDHVTFVRNSGYWRSGKPYLDQVEVRVTPDPQSALVALEAGNVDWMAGVPSRDARRLQDDPKYRVMLTASGGEIYCVGLDLTVPTFADRRVRQALGYALNRPRMVDTALFGFGRPASIPWPQQSLAYDAAQDQTYTFDLAKARQLLESAGWQTGTSIPLSIVNTTAAARMMAEIFQADLATIGVNLTLQELAAADFVARYVGGSFGGAWLVGIGFMNLSPATFLTSALAVRRPNPSHFDTPRYAQLIEQTAAEVDDQKLKALLHEVTQMWLDESFVIPIAEGASRDSGPEVVRASVHDVAWDAFGLFGHESVWLQR